MRNKISAVGVKSPAGLSCPKCGGTQFKAKRSKKGLLVAAIAPKSQVKCVTCGTLYKRG